MTSKSCSPGIVKLLHLMIARTGGAMEEDRHHEFRASDFRAIKGMRKHDKARPIKDGRHVDAVCISWEVKPDTKPVKAERFCRKVFSGLIGAVFRKFKQPSWQIV